MRYLKCEALKNLYNTYEDLSGKVNYRIYNNLELKPIGIVEDAFIAKKENWILDDCNFVTEKRVALGDVRIREENVIYCGFMRNQWGHFIVNSMSRIWFIYAHPEVKYDKIIFALPPNQNNLELKGNYKEFFRILGLLDKIEFISSPVAFRTVIVPELSWSLQHHFSEEFNLVFDELVRIVSENSSYDKGHFPQKVFFTRSKLNTSFLCELGIEILDDFFRRNGFEIIAPETLNLTQTILLMQNAEVVASASGSTAHNILFGKKKQKLIIAERNVINNDFQPGINLVRCIDAVYIDSFLTINSVNLGLGPFFYYPTTYLLNFAGDNGYVGPDNKFLSERYLKNNLKKYFRTWKKFYHRQWYYQKFSLGAINSFYEAYTESFDVTGDYLCGTKSLYISDILSFDRIVKRVVKNDSVLAFMRKIKRFIHR